MKKTYTQKDVAARIDHAILKPFARDADVVAAARMCVKRGVYSICVRPSDVELAAKEVAGSQTCVSTVVGFPHGANLTAVKRLEAEKSIRNGASELDMVMNIGKFLSENFAYVENDIAAVVECARVEDVLVKVILEICYLSNGQIATACKIAEAAGADFVKTSTGFGENGATPEAVAIMLETVGGSMKVKASGGIRDWDTAVNYLEQGCARLGIGSTETVLDGGLAEGDY